MELFTICSVSVENWNCSVSVEILKTQPILNSQLYLTLLWVRGLDKMISKVPIQPQFFCQSLISYNMVFIYKQELIITQVDMLK